MNSYGIAFAPRKFNFRSPNLGQADYNLFIVYDDGHVYIGVGVDWDSYGRISPYHTDDDIAYHVSPDGDVDYNYNGWGVAFSSCGRSSPQQSDNETVYIVNPQGRADYYGPGISVNVEVTHSYGNIYFSISGL